MATVVLFFTIFATYVCFVNGQSSCSSGDVCKSLNDCSPLLEIVEKPVKTREYIEFTESISQCGYEANVSKVCCPNTCYTPDGKAGKCVSIYSCLSLVSLLMPPVSREIMQFVQNSRCTGPDQFSVCCVAGASDQKTEAVLNPKESAASVSQIVAAQVSRKFFRNDYTYLENTDGFYKIHTMAKTSSDAARTCASEGSKLFYPQDKKEAVIVTGFLRKTQPHNRVFLGASDVVVKGYYETFDGVPIQDLYHNWAKGEPNGSDSEESCVVLTEDSTLRDEPCKHHYPFICKKTLDSVQWNERCNMPDLAYEYNEKLKRCYKYHGNPMNWTKAYAVCNTEESYLAVINSEEEADYIIDLINRSPKDSRARVHLGFHNRRNIGWITVKGVPVAESGYSKWAPGEPNNVGVCGSIIYGGGYKAIACDFASFFICEHDLA